MKLYIKAYSSYITTDEEVQLKKVLKEQYKLDTRRQDSFIHLAIYGAQKLKENIAIDPQDELYITSGEGNIDVLQKTHHYVHKLDQFIKPFDFINMLGNTTSYYVASSLGVKGKNTYQISDTFTYIHSLISVYASLHLSQKEAILGAVDLVTQPKEILQRVLGVPQDLPLASAANYQKLSLDSKDALGSIEFDTKEYEEKEIEELVQKTQLKVLLSPRCEKTFALKPKYFYETLASGIVNEALKTEEEILFIDCAGDKYKTLKVTPLHSFKLAKTIIQNQHMDG